MKNSSIILDRKPSFRTSASPFFAALPAFCIETTIRRNFRLNNGELCRQMGLKWGSNGAQMGLTEEAIDRWVRGHGGLLNAANGTSLRPQREQLHLVAPKSSFFKGRIFLFYRRSAFIHKMFRKCLYKLFIYKVPPYPRAPLTLPCQALYKLHHF